MPTVPATPVLVEWKRTNEVKLDLLAIVERAITVALDERKVDEDASRCLRGLSYTPPFFLVPLLYHGTRHGVIVCPVW
ncbi:MAG: hypothetical protein QOE43_283 [Gaiellaceae bacterium]|nr:hypothetical protein [Gaiellaceae bacterium]